MYTNHSSSQFHRCLICQKYLKNDTILSFIRTPLICHTCLSSFQIFNYQGYIQDYPIHILYHYNDFFKTILYQYKGQYDYALKDIFLIPYPTLRHTYKDHMIVVAPSYSKDRLFAPNTEIAKHISTHIFTGLYKKEPYKQSQRTYKDRKDIQSIIDIKGGCFLENQKVLIFDDVLTSSYTIRTCIQKVLPYRPKSIEILILSTRRTIKELRSLQ